MSGGGWFSETLTPGVHLSFEADAVLLRDKSEEHDVALIENAAFGRVLLIDGAVQLTSRDEFIYHEMMAHVPILAHRRPRSVLIIGGGDGGLAEEVLRHSSVQRVTQVEIDRQIVELARRHFGDVHGGAFDDPRFELVIGDGAEFVRDSDERFDVALVDSTDPVGPGKALFTPEFYRDVHARLARGGILVTQSGVPFLQAEEFRASMSGLAAAFGSVSCYAIAVPTYFGGHLALGWASDDDTALGLTEREIAARFAAAGLSTRYYTPRLHRAAFVLPRYIEAAVEAAASASGATS